MFMPRLSLSENNRACSHGPRDGAWPGAPGRVRTQWPPRLHRERGHTAKPGLAFARPRRTFPHVVLHLDF